MSLKQFPDWNKHLQLTAHSLNILRLATELSETEGRMKPPQTDAVRKQFKATVLSHVSAHNYIITDEDFYQFNIDKLIQAESPV